MIVMLCVCAWVPQVPLRQFSALAAAACWSHVVRTPCCVHVGQAIEATMLCVMTFLSWLASPTPPRRSSPLVIASRPELRPVDLRFSGATCRLAALDVGIVSPDAQGAGQDCVASMYARKVERYSSFTFELDRAGSDYVPLVWSCYGRPHGRTSAVLRVMAGRAARRRGLDAKALLRRVHAQIGVEVWRRAARMVGACWPKASMVDD